MTERKQALGPWTRGQRNAVLAFGVTVCLWIGPGLLALVIGRDHPLALFVQASMPEAVAALTGAILLFLLPASREQRTTITWKQAAQIDWGTILLFGGDCRSARCRRPPDWRWRWGRASRACCRPTPWCR